ncbi:uncharacterized protein LOC125739109 [Brienomyrus brachyistius]|uniref:uncharacterized protein LOC125739109 n=1 Tax=Brienomyrus brachyistius TaxID=42636 RepID=UPI0020B36AF0|nr:uncharacterized protein LOC125739109 [Brienomyrus brachyistius]
MGAGDSLTFWGLAVLVLPGVMSHNWNVSYAKKPVCAVRGSTVVIPCGYDYPEAYKVETIMWCHNVSDCIDKPYVCHNNNINVSSQYKGRAECLGDKENNCTLRIKNITDDDAGVYKFRFITSNNNGKWTGQPGVTLKVNGGAWAVDYAERTLCAVRGLTVVIHCRFNHPESYRVESMMWNHKTEDCAGKSYVWQNNSHKINISTEYRDRAKFLGNTENNCTLMIKNITDADAGLYRFSFTAGGCELCAQPGVELQVGGGAPSVDYAERTLCAVRGSTVVIHCRFYHPESYRMESMMWSHNTEDCAGKSNVWHNNSHKINITTEYRDRAEVLGNTENNCTLMIKNITDADAGLYRFSFTAGECELCAQPGVELRVGAESNPMTVILVCLGILLPVLAVTICIMRSQKISSMQTLESVALRPAARGRKPHLRGRKSAMLPCSLTPTPQAGSVMSVTRRALMMQSCTLQSENQPSAVKPGVFLTCDSTPLLPPAGSSPPPQGCLDRDSSLFQS